MPQHWQKELKKALKGTAMDSISGASMYHPAGHQLFSTVVTDSQLQQADLNDPLDPISLQFIPQIKEKITHPEFKSDPVGDGAATASTGLIHKYQGRVLLIASGSCAVNCRYCFRRHFEYNKNFAPRNNWQEAVKYISHDESIHEVILSGGDPLTLSTEKLKGLTDQLEALAHVKTLRIHSRIPVVLPQRIDSEFTDFLKQLKLNIVMVLHINHSQELSKDAQSAIQALKACHGLILNQSVLLKDINDDAATLVQLSHDLHDLGVMPYYLHTLDKVQNASHFEVPLSQAQSIHKQLQTRLPGYLVPKLCTEIKGQDSKTWVNNA